MPRPSVMPGELQEKARTILTKYGIDYDGRYFRLSNPNGRYSWNQFHTSFFFSMPLQRIGGCCGVIEMHQCTPPTKWEFFPVDITPDEWTTLFKYHVRDVLFRANRRIALVTLINSQKEFVPFLEAADFKLVSTGFNPSTRRNNNIWVLSI